MINIIKANKRYFADEGWLKTYRLFAFAEYQDAENVRWGALRVFNDDTLAPGSGFPNHPHQDIEVVTIVLSGELTHQDKTGMRSVMRQGDIHCLSGGTGIMYSDFNYGGVSAHFYKIWIFPDINGIAPRFEQKNIAEQMDALVPVASGQGIEGAVAIMADASVYLGVLEAGKHIEFKTAPDRKLFLYMTQGQASLNGVRMSPFDQARISGEALLTISAKTFSRFILIDVPEVKE